MFLASSRLEDPATARVPEFDLPPLRLPSYITSIRSLNVFVLRGLVLGGQRYELATSVCLARIRSFVGLEWTFSEFLNGFELSNVPVLSLLLRSIASVVPCRIRSAVSIISCTLLSSKLHMYDEKASAEAETLELIKNAPAGFMVMS